MKMGEEEIDRKQTGENLIKKPAGHVPIGAG
jgi:hypothetical protein